MGVRGALVSSQWAKEERPSLTHCWVGSNSTEKKKLRPFRPGHKKYFTNTDSESIIDIAYFVDTSSVLCVCEKSPPDSSMMFKFNFIRWT